MKSMGGAGGMAGAAAAGLTFLVAHLHPRLKRGPKVCLNIFVVDAAADAAVLAKTLRNAFSAVKSATLAPRADGAGHVDGALVVLLLLLFIVHQLFFGWLDQDHT